MSERRLTPDDVAAELGIPKNVLAQWKYRKRITPVGFIPGHSRQVPLYLRSELQPLVDRWLADRDTPTGNSR